MACEPEPEPAFATLEADPAPKPDRGPVGSVSIEARGATVRLDGGIGAGRIAEIASVARALRAANAPREAVLGQRPPRRPQRLRLDVPEYSATPRISLQMLDVRHPLEVGDVENPHCEDHPRIARALRRAAVRAREIDENAPRSRHFEPQHPPRRVPRRPCPPVPLRA